MLRANAGTVASLQQMVGAVIAAEKDIGKPAEITTVKRWEYHSMHQSQNVAGPVLPEHNAPPKLMKTATGNSIWVKP